MPLFRKHAEIWDAHREMSPDTGKNNYYIGDYFTHIIKQETVKMNIFCCSVTQLCLTIWDPTECSTPGFPVPQYLSELSRTHVHWVSDAIQSSHSLLLLLLLPSISPSIRIFSNELALCNRWSKYWSFSISPSNEYSGLVSFTVDWFDLLAVWGTIKRLL